MVIQSQTSTDLPITETDSSPTCPVCHRPLRSGELICMTCSSLVLQTGHTRLIAADTPTPQAMNRPLYAGLVTDLKPITFDIEGKLLSLPIRGQIIVGRYSISSDIQPDVDLNPFGGETRGVSRHHVRISYLGALIYITDLGSLNGSWLNGMALIPQVRRLLRDGDLLQLGQLKIRVRF